MKSVAFFDWKLNESLPVSRMIIHRQGYSRPSLQDVHSAIHLGIVISGDLEGIFGGSRLKLNSSELYLTAPWEPHSTIACNSGRQDLVLINIDIDSLQNFFFAGADQLHALLSMLPDERMRYLNTHCRMPELIERLTALANLADDEPNQVLKLWNGVLNFFIEVLPEKSTSAALPGNYQKILPALQKLSGNMLTLPEAAELCGLSTSYFAAIFRKQFGVSFARYERNFRLNRAAGAIRRGATLKEAAAGWGFCDKSHLARLLKQHLQDKNVF